MRISVVLPCKNVSCHIEECLDSILTNRADVVDEIVCVDDCSTDDTLAILESYARKEKRVRIVRHPVNKGTNEARRSGVLAARGDYVLFADPDDRFVEGAIGVIRKRLESNGVDVLFFGFRPFDRPTESFSDNSIKAKYFDRVQDGHRHVTTKESALEMIYSELRLSVMVWARAWRRDVLVAGFGLIPVGWCVEQEDDCEHLAFLAFAETVDSIDFIGYEYRYDAGISNERIDEKSASRYLRNSIFMDNFIRSFKENFRDVPQYDRYLLSVEINRQDKFGKIAKWLLEREGRIEKSPIAYHSAEPENLWYVFAVAREKKFSEFCAALAKLPFIDLMIRLRRLFVRFKMFVGKRTGDIISFEKESLLLKDMRCRIKEQTRK